MFDKLLERPKGRFSDPEYGCIRYYRGTSTVWYRFLVSGIKYLYTNPLALVTEVSVERLLPHLNFVFNKYQTKQVYHTTCYTIKIN